MRQILCDKCHRKVASELELQFVVTEDKQHVKKTYELCVQCFTNIKHNLNTPPDEEG